MEIMTKGLDWLSESGLDRNIGEKILSKRWGENGESDSVLDEEPRLLKLDDEDPGRKTAGQIVDRVGG